MIFSPAWLWLCSFILIPIFIHLWNRKLGKSQLLGTFRFLPEDSFNAPRHIQIHEIPLLLLRILMVALISLLLANISWLSDVEPVETITIIETSGDPSLSKKDEQNPFTIEITSTVVDEKKWWNILAQIMHQYDPDSITISGNFSVDNFGEKRLPVNAVVEWKTADSLSTDKKEHIIWRSQNNPYKKLSQQRTDNGISINIENLQSLDDQNTDIPVLDSLKLIINAQNSEEIKNGLRHAAFFWHMETEEQEIAEIAKLVSSSNSWPLIQHSAENGMEDYIQPNSVFGIQSKVSGIDTTIGMHSNNLLISEVSNSPVLFHDGNGFTLNGNVDSNIESWIFAGIGSALIWNAFRIENELSPELAEENRMVKDLTSADYVPKQKQSARIWLISLLAVCWFAERMLAPKRGM